LLSREGVSGLWPRRYCSSRWMRSSPSAQQLLDQRERDPVVPAVVVTRVSGKLKPGDYSNQQLRRILVRAFPREREVIRRQLGG
jgi:hypothetical protein